MLTHNTVRLPHQEIQEEMIALYFFCYEPRQRRLGM